MKESRMLLNGQLGPAAVRLGPISLGSDLAEAA
jgi:hypothetical protein